MAICNGQMYCSHTVYLLMDVHLPICVSMHFPIFIAPYRACLMKIIWLLKHCALNVSNAQYSVTSMLERSAT